MATGPHPLFQIAKCRRRVALVGLGGALNLNVGATDVTVAGLELGGTASAVATTVSSTGGRLIFRNADPAVTPDIPFNAGSALIVSGGVVGSTNTITAPITINNDKLDVGAASTNDLVISGDVRYNGSFSAGIRSFLPTGKKVLVTGTIDLTDHTDAATELVVSTFNLNDSQTNQGTLEISGVMSGIGGLNMGSSSANALRPLGTIILSGDNTFTGRAEADRGNIVLAHNNALAPAQRASTSKGSRVINSVLI